MRVHIQKWGNSFALRIPQPFAKEIHIEKGATVELSVKGGKLILSPLSKPEYTLKELLSGVTKQNIHHEIDIGEHRGREIW